MPLHLISTPIGNLGDLSFRAVEVLKASDYILCEDTRHSRVLLDHYQIQVPLKAFHKFNLKSAENQVLEDLKSGQNISLISDAGTPLIADPGEELVLACHREDIQVTAIPGACALIDALLLSGFPSPPFQFLGFLPKKQKELQAVLSHALIYPGTTITYETPHRIEETLEMLSVLSPLRQLCVARELTKRYEETLRGTALNLLAHFKLHPPRGEIVLLIAPGVEAAPYEDLSLEDLVETLKQDFNLTQQEAIKMAAQMRKVPKRDVYKLFTND